MEHPPREEVVQDLQTRTVSGVFPDLRSAEIAADGLIAAGYSRENFSVLVKPPGSPPNISSAHMKTGEGAAAGAGAGAVVGGALALAALAIPGVGPFLAAGPLFSALAGVAAGGAMGGLLGSFAGLGIPDEHARAYDEAVRSGGVVVAIMVPSGDEVPQASSILERYGATNITSFAPTY